MNLWGFCTWNDDCDDANDLIWHVYRIVCMHYLFQDLQSAYKLESIVPIVLHRLEGWGERYVLYLSILDSGEKALTIHQTLFVAFQTKAAILRQTSLSLCLLFFPGFHLQLLQGLFRLTFLYPSKIKARIAIWSNNSTFRYISEGNKITIPKRYLHSHVQGSIIYKS